MRRDSTLVQHSQFSRRDTRQHHKAFRNVGSDEANSLPRNACTKLRRVQLFDVSHTVEAGMQTYKGLPGPVICDYLSREASRKLYSPGTEFQIGRIEMVANTGTYVDSPFHRYADGKDLAGLSLESLANVPCLVARIDPAAGRMIDALPFSAADVRGKAVLVQTSWDRNWRKAEYFEGFPHLTGRLAQWLRDSGAVIVGIDSHNIDCTDTGERPVHSTLLGAGIPIVEHLCGLQSVPTTGARFFAVPVKVKGFGTFPVRAFAVTA
jgi:arylformamidase